MNDSIDRAKPTLHHSAELVGLFVRYEINACSKADRSSDHRSCHDRRNSTRHVIALFDALFGVVEMQAQEITVINQSARQQSLSSDTVMQIMQAVSNSTQQNSVTTHSVAQSMERLASLAQQLQSSVGAFKLREDRIDNNSGRNMLNQPRNGNHWPPSGPLHTFAGAVSSGDNGRWNAPVATPAPGRGKDGFSQQPVPTYPNNRRARYRVPEQGR